MTNNPDIPMAKSIVDYIFRWLGRKFLPAAEQPVPPPAVADEGSRTGLPAVGVGVNAGAVGGGVIPPGGAPSAAGAAPTPTAAGKPNPTGGSTVNAAVGAGPGNAAAPSARGPGEGSPNVRAGPASSAGLPAPPADDPNSSSDILRPLAKRLNGGLKETRPPQQVVEIIGLEGAAPTRREAKVTAREKTVFLNQADAPTCSECGAIMVRNGSCYRCHECGTTSGCS
jgi:ribonucleoside-diphosphate reductase alpha chain